LFSLSKIKMVYVATTLEPLPGSASVGDETVETRAQKRLKAGFAGVVSGEVILFEAKSKEALREILGVFVIGAPLQANVFVCGFPVARENGVEGATADTAVVAAGVDDGGVIGDREFVKRATDVSIRISHCTGFTRFYRMNMFILNNLVNPVYVCRLTITNVMSSAALVP